MSERSLHQYFGPSERHPRACVELGFDVDGARYALAPFEAVLAQAGINPSDPFPKDPVPLEEAVCRLALALMARPTPPWSSHGREGGRGWVALGYPYAHVAATVLELAHDAALAGAVPAAAAKARPIAEWFKKVNQIQVWMIAAAEMFGRSSAILNATTGIYQVGQGAKGVHFMELGNSRDGLTGMIIENSKRNTIEVLRRLGLPTTRGVLVSSAEQAAKAVQSVGLPAVVKPLSMARGEGVATGLASPRAVAAAAANALKLSRKPVLVENHVDGHDHRLTVFGEELLWAYRKMPATVTGNGKATVAELIGRENQRRAAIRSGTEAYLYQIDPNQDLARFIAERYQLRLDGVLPKGQRIELAGQANIARGGFLEDVTEQVHPDNRALAIRVARLVRLYAVGIDYITPDISRSWKDGGTAIVEINRTPGISGMGDASLVHRTFFPNRRSGQAPMVAAIGDADYRAAAAEAFGAAFAKHRLRLATAEYGALRQDRPVRSFAGAHVVDTLVLDPEADAGLVLCDPERVATSGFPLQHCDVLAVQDAAQSPWLAADTLVAGKLAKTKAAELVGKLAKLYAEPGEGGPLPVLEAGAVAKDAFQLTVWRARAMPREWFWAKVGAASPYGTGMTTHADMLAAVRTLAGMKTDFTHGEIVGPWFRVTFEASIALPPRNKDKARAALAKAVARVNAIAAMEIG